MDSIRKRVWIVYCDNFSAFFICQRSCGISVLCAHYLCRNVWCSMKKRTLNTLLNTLNKKRRRIGIAKKKPQPQFVYDLERIMFVFYTWYCTSEWYMSASRLSSFHVSCYFIQVLPGQAVGRSQQPLVIDQTAPTEVKALTGLKGHLPWPTVPGRFRPPDDQGSGNGSFKSF